LAENVGDMLQIMAEPGAAEITPRPASGRIFESGRRVRLADVDPTSRCRLDALVRHLQDVARDDSADSNLSNPMNWVVRRTMLEIHQPPQFEEWLDIATWCSGFGGRWAERRTELRGDRGAHVEGSTLWVFVDGETGRPARLPPDFFEIWGATAGDRRVSARTTLPSSWPDDVHDDEWPVRFSDLDVLGHVNNAAQWMAVEEALERAGQQKAPVRAELEHGPGVEPDTDVRLKWRAVDGGVDTWLTTDGTAGSVARVRPL
jgi:acyl-ACP thioesterase